MLFTIEDDDDLFLYEEDDFLDDKEAIIDLAFGENEMIEALIVILSLILILSRSLKLFFFCVYFFSLSSVLVFVSAGLIWLSVVFYINPEKKKAKKNKKRGALSEEQFGVKSDRLFLFFKDKKNEF